MISTEDGNVSNTKKLLKAIANENLEEVEELLQKTHLYMDKNRRNVFHYAAKIRNMKILELLGSQLFELVNEADELGEYPIHRAARFDNLRVIKTLHGMGATLMMRNKEGLNVLHIAVLKENESMTLFLSGKMDINSRTEDSKGSLHIAVMQSGLNMVKILLDSSADVNQLNKHGDSPLHYAASLGHADICKLLLKSGVNIDSANENGNTALHLAVEMHNISIVELLLKNSPKLDILNKKGETALNVADRKKTLLSPLGSNIEDLPIERQDKIRKCMDIIKAIKKKKKSVHEILKKAFNSSKKCSDKESKNTFTKAFMPFRRIRSCFD